MTTIYVDALFEWGGRYYSGHDAAQAARVGARNGHRWCHLFSDELGPDFSALHAFAKRIGLKRSWFQGNHYDLTPRRRARAIKLGALPASRKEAVTIWRAQRERARTP